MDKHGLIFLTLTYVFEGTWIKYMDKHGLIFLTLTYVFEGTWIKYMDKQGLIFLTLTYVFERTLINTWITWTNYFLTNMCPSGQGKYNGILLDPQSCSMCLVA
jgi:hypothetical protein